MRHMRKREMEAEVGRFMRVYNVAWGRNWGFVPITAAEVKFQAKNLKPILDEAWAMIAEKDGEVVGAALTLLDVDQALARMKGCCRSAGGTSAAAGATSTGCGSALGVLPSASTSGSRPHCMSAISSPPLTRPSGGHMGWILETNKPMNRAMEGMGGRIVQRHRSTRRTSPLFRESVPICDLKSPRSGVACGFVAEEVLEAEAIEEDTAVDAMTAVPPPAPRAAGEVSLLGSEARTVAIAAAGGGSPAPRPSPS